MAIQWRQPAGRDFVDNSRTASIRNGDSPVYKLLNSSGDVQKSAPQGSDRDLLAATNSRS